MGHRGENVRNCFKISVLQRHFFECPEAFEITNELGIDLIVPDKKMAEVAEGAERPYI